MPNNPDIALLVLGFLASTWPAAAASKNLAITSTPFIVPSSVFSFKSFLCIEGLITLVVSNSCLAISSKASGLLPKISQNTWCPTSCVRMYFLLFNTWFSTTAYVTLRPSS